MKMILLIFISFAFICESFAVKYNLLNQDYYDVDKIDDIFKQYIDKYGKQYVGEEYKLRRDVLKENLIKLNEWNKNDPGVYGDNEFTDLTEEEFVQKHLGPHRYASNIPSDNNVEEIKMPIDVNRFINERNITHIDWRDYGAVTPVRAQLNCGSTYAFSAIGSIEGQYALKYNTTAISLSVQQILDCDTYDGGCYGGMAVYAMASVKKQKGLMREMDYPYEAKTGIIFTEKMRHIKTGKVYKPDDCQKNKYAFNAEVLIVGYGRENDDDYWILKNSWGTHWGDRGYMRIIRGSKACNIGLLISLPEIS
ncbi:cathepsin L-like proteinase isoform X3 [Colias croceus]|uniref:cathepsin L-like proteinase isoform X3 n=1 Tax=Colias crocea TaxID=72248 RepID=UPI001E27ED16|nr:cathepsin L-like proteinase isoform X3 [Colias croceus]